MEICETTHYTSQIPWVLGTLQCLVHIGTV